MSGWWWLLAAWAGACPAVLLLVLGAAARDVLRDQRAHGVAASRAVHPAGKALA